MRIVFPCTNCDLRLTIEAFEAEHQVACPNCGTSLLVPSARPGPGIILRNYLIEERVGRTNMGMAYTGRELSTRDDVALIILPGWFSTDREAGLLLQHEIRTVAPINHPHIIRTYDGGEDNGVYFLVAERIDGEDLAAKVQREGVLDEVQALELATRLGRALQYAWDEFGILHRNLSPSAIIVDRYGEPRLARTGITQPVYPGSKRSPRDRPDDEYRTPEEFAGEQRTVGTDIYALGATLFFAVTGKVPFAQNMPDLSAPNFTAPPLPDPRVYNTNLSPQLVALLSRMLAYAPDDRHADWPDLLADIARVRAGRAPQLSALPPGESVLDGSDASGKPATVKRAPVAPTRDVASAHEPDSEMPPLPRRPWKRYATVAICFIVGLTSGVLIVGPRLLTDPVREKTRSPVPRTVATDLIHSDLLTQFSNAVAYLAFHPNDYRGAVDALESFRHSAIGTDYEREADRELAKMETVYQDVIDGVMGRLRRESEEIAASRRKGDARDHLINYTGRFAADTKAQRRAMAAELDSLDERFGDRWKDVAATVAARVLSEDYTSAQTRIRDALSGPMRTEDRLKLQAWADTLAEMASLDLAILDSFRMDIGRTITVGFRTGREYLRIEKVRGDHVMANKFKEGMRHDAIPTARPFSMTDLSDAERFRRLGTSPDPATDILRGVLALRSGAPGSARKYLERSTTSLGTLLAEYVQRVRGEG